MPAGEETRAGVIDAMLDGAGGAAQADGDEKKCGSADGQVDVKDPAPGKQVGDNSTEKRPGHTAGGEDGAEETLVAAALAGRDQIADCRLSEGEQAARAEPLEGTEENQLHHGLREAAEDGAEKENADGPRRRAACAHTCR